MGIVSTANITRNELIERALRRLGEGDPSTSEIANAVKLLNHLIKRIDIEGRWLWAVSNTGSTFSTVAAQPSYSVSGDSIATDILALEKVFWAQGANSEIPLDILDKSDYLAHGLRVISGDPLLAYLETAPLGANQKIWLAPIPAAVKTIKYFYRRRLYDFSLATDNPDMPGEWIDALTKRLSVELAPEYGTPLAERQWLKGEAMEAMKLVNSENAEEPPEQTTETHYF